MADFSAFMAQNVEKIPNKRLVVSKRFKDENGKPMEWEIRAITAEESDEISRRAMIQVPVAGQRGKFTREVDQVKFVGMLVAASVVFPDLNDAALQDSYGVKTPEALIKKMLYTREETYLTQEVVNHSGLEEIGDLVEEAKN